MFVLGAEHILDKEASLFGVPTPYVNDHGFLLLSILLIPGYLLGSWTKRRRLLEYATAFALGHGMAIFTVSFTGLAAPEYLVETGIALSIAVLGLERLATVDGYIEDSVKRNLLILAVTGFVHGNGFSIVANEVTFNSLTEAVTLLTAFTLGVDVGQFVFLAVAGLGLYGLMYRFSEQQVIRYTAAFLVVVGMGWAVFRFLPEVLLL